ncbi:MAG: electron transfer flavoprotein subunit alpha [Flavobacteriales bacterium]|nr:electron transfer flavoprotein subunit alpha [Flavobacteriales bacterium]|tara:strand:- start:7359 stop:8120 length:762 start_codon:yes stop_codon:yes gene_type:complete
MNILVCISSVPDTTSKINFTNNNQEFDTNGVTFIINPYDEFCLTKAIFLKEQSSDPLNCTITVLHIGTSSSDPILRKALAIGADKAVRIDQVPQNSKVVANNIFDYYSKNSFDLIFCGKESIDYNGGQVPGLLAAKINAPFINGCVGLELKNNSIEVKREVDSGHEISECNLPAVIAGQKGLVEEKDLRIPSMRGIMTARTKPLQVINSNIEITETFKITTNSKPVERSECKIIDEENIEKLVDLLSNEAKVI